MNRLLLSLLLLAPAAADIGAKVGGNKSPTGKEVELDYPEERHQHNKAGKDGAGLCVFTSISQAGDWQNVPGMVNMRDWMQKYPGGGWPAKVKEMVAKKCKAEGWPVPDFIIDENGDLAILELALTTGRMPCVTYGISPTGRYNGQHIAHMVNLVHGDKDEWCVLDNNYKDVEWMSRKEFSKAYNDKSKGWCVIFLSPGPPPPPRN